MIPSAVPHPQGALVTQKGQPLGVPSKGACHPVVLTAQRG